MTQDTIKISELNDKIIEKIALILEKAAKEDCIDFFKIEITNHQGALQTDYQFRDRTKVY